MTATLVGPGEVPAFTETLDQQPGTYPVAFPPAPLDPMLPPAPPAEGRWRLDVTATDDLGQTSTTSQSFTVNSTLGFPKLSAGPRRSRPRHADDPGGCHARASGTCLRHG